MNQNEFLTLKESRQVTAAIDEAERSTSAEIKLQEKAPVTGVKGGLLELINRSISAIWGDMK